MAEFPWPMRWDPFREFQRDVHRILETLSPGRAFGMRPYPPLNLFDLGSEFRVVVQAPGLSAADLDLSITHETLTIRGERKRPHDVADESYRRHERFFGAWTRSLTLPDRVDADQVTAECLNGLLTIRLPKAEPQAPRQIPVLTGDRC